jgi:hypothetical protein
MLNLEKRITALEKTQVLSTFTTILRRFVSPGHLNAEIDHISDDLGNEWIRQPDETEAAFTDRATSETSPSKWSIKMLVGKTLELSHTDH